MKCEGYSCTNEAGVRDKYCSECLKEELKLWALAIKEILNDNHIRINYTREVSHGIQFKLRCGFIVNIYRTGKILFQGKPNSSIKKIILK